VNFINEFIEVLDRRRGEFEQLVSGGKEPTEIEISLMNHLQHHWHDNPPMIGSDGSAHKQLKFEMLKGIRDPAIASTFERVLRDLIEIEIVVEKCSELDNSMVMIDGNLYGRFTHLLKQLFLKGWEALPLYLFDAMQKLFKLCTDRNITLIGVSKFSKTRVFCSAMLTELGVSMTDPEYLDVDLLYRWKNEETGYTTPLLLGEYAFVDEVRAMHDEPENYRKRFFGSIPRDLHDWGTDVIMRIPLAPAIVMFHFIPSKFEQPLRIDIPATCLGLGDKIMDVSPYRFVKPELVKPIVQQLVEDWGGMDVYNALLYVVDKEVRLGSGVVDRVYRSILGRELDVPIMYDRNTRRFFS
jgi:hypothetical protein